MNNRNIISSIILATALLGPNAVPAADTGTSRVAEQARFWEERGRQDLANEAWQKVLKADPDNAEARAALNPNRPESQQAPAQAVDPVKQDALAQARSQSQAKNYDAAITSYRRYLGDNQPEGALGLEFYQTLAGTENGWQEAEQGLKRLKNADPAEPRYEFAYAQHLTYREKSRRDGIQQLAALEQQQPAVSEKARAARRQALVWLGATRSDIPLYRQYLEAHPTDTVVKERLVKVQKDTAKPKPAAAPKAVARRAQPPAAPRPPPAEDVFVKQGYESLDDNRLDDAETQFRQALNINGNDPNALGGIGIIRLRTERFREAEQLLVAASRAEPSTAGRWQEALGSARFWATAREADAAQKAGQLDQAIQLFRNALNMNPRETVVRIGYADTLLAAGNLDEALINYQQTLAEDRDNARSQRGIVSVLAQQGRTREALEFAERIPEEERGQIGGLTNLRAQSLRAAAEQAHQQNDLVRAEALLRDALALDPNSPYIRLDLARLYRKAKQPEKAKSLVDGLLASEGNLPDAIFIKALILSEEQKWWDALQILERVPPRERSQGMRDLQKRMWIRYETERAVAFSREGQLQAAQQILDRVEQISGTEPEALGALATGYAEAGEPRRAVALMRQALSQMSDPSPSLRLQYAGLLSKLGQDVEFDVQLDVLRRLHGQLTAAQREGLAGLESGSAIRKADRLREVGRFADAYEYLRPHLEASPDDSSLLSALARLYGDFKEPDRALDLYYDLLEADPEDLNTFDGAIRSAIDAGRPDEAQWLVDRALNLSPANPRLYVLAGRLARARGDDDQAVSLFKQALALDAENSAEGLGPGGKETSRAPLYLIGEQQQQLRDSNPFGEPRALRYEEFNRPVGPRRPVGDLPPGGFQRTSADPNDYRYSLPPERQGVSRSYIPPPEPEPRYYGAPLTAQQSQEYYPPLQPRQIQPRRIPPQQAQPRQVQYPAAQPRQTQRRQVQPQQIQPRQIRREPLPVNRFTAERAPLRRSGGQPVAAVRIEQDLRPTRLVRRRLDGPMRPEALSSRRSSINPRGALIDEIADIESTRTNWTAGGLNLRNRDGQSGLGELIDIETPVEGSFGQLGPGRVRIRAVPVFLNAGSLAGSDATSFGLLPIAEAEGVPGAAAAVVQSADYNQSESGVAIGLVYELRDWRFDLGSTPLGFPEENLVGGLRWSPTFDNILLNVDLSRRSVTDSLLSYAGTRDPFLNAQAGNDITFGGVARNGGRLDIANDQGSFGIYGNIGGYFIDGEQVEDNMQLELGGGYYQHLWRRPDNQFTVGLNVTTFFYEENLSQFTLGHGGYFSPQFYASVGVPIEWVGRQSRLSYRVGGSLGVQSFSEDDPDIFPGNFGGAQTRLENAGGLNGVTRVEGASATGLGFNLFGGAEYLLSPHLSFGAKGSFDNAKDFNQLSIGAYLRYWFRPQRPNRLPPPRYLAPFYVGDPEW